MRSPVPPRLFTPAEVDALLPELVPLMETVMDRYRQASALRRALEEEHEQRAGAGRAATARPEWQARLERLDGLGIEVRQAVAAVVALGGVIKDLEIGLVDFPGLIPGIRDEEPVNLCWKHGETAVRFWHGFDEGYAQRKPLP
ncbi:MAG: DUF2203 domain-containing protein [Candidatus Rokubacteria bacterium]|nr:DUF2203 domain-containing protein [Candidatus Rokubacteria bacterium]